MLPHYNLIVLLIKREIIGRYRGSFLGFFWSFIHPVFMLAVYTFVFGFVFKARWGIQQENSVNFAAVLFTGLIAFNLFSECISKAPALILANINYVKKVVFPLHILPIVSLGAALFHTLISLIILFIFMILTGHSMTLTSLTLPLILIPFVFLIMGLSWFLASIGVFLRDINQLIGIVLTALLFLSPIFYPISAVPDTVQSYLYWNPLTFIVEQMRQVLIWGNWPDGFGLFIYFCLSSVIFATGWLWFVKTSKGFSDVL